MPKVIELTFEIEVQKVSCPGVWLCQDGRVSLTVFALGTSYQTCLLPPVFPLMFKDIFYFRKRFQETCALNNICCLLKDETIYCELVQWSADCVNSTCAVLAQYLGSLNDILFPPNMCAGEGVDLLMRRAKNFPGILSPKIEIATKVRIDEIYSQPHTAHRPNTCRCVRSDANTTRQKQVCHSQQYHRAAMVSPKRSTETSTYYPCDQEYRYAGNAQKGTELLSPGEREFTQKSNRSEGPQQKAMEPYSFDTQEIQDANRSQASLDEAADSCSCSFEARCLGEENRNDVPKEKAVESRSIDTQKLEEENRSQASLDKPADSCSCSFKAPSSKEEKIRNDVPKQKVIESRNVDKRKVEEENRSQASLDKPADSYSCSFKAPSSKEEKNRNEVPKQKVIESRSIDTKKVEVEKSSQASLDKPAESCTCSFKAPSSKERKNRSDVPKQKVTESQKQEKVEEEKRSQASLDKPADSCSKEEKKRNDVHKQKVTESHNADIQKVEEENRIEVPKQKVTESHTVDTKKPEEENRNEVPLKRPTKSYCPEECGLDQRNKTEVPKQKVTELPSVDRQNVEEKNGIKVSKQKTELHSFGTQKKEEEKRIEVPKQRVTELRSVDTQKVEEEKRAEIVLPKAMESCGTQKTCGVECENRSKVPLHKATDSGSLDVQKLEEENRNKLQQSKAIESSSLDKLDPIEENRNGKLPRKTTICFDFDEEDLREENRYKMHFSNDTRDMVQKNRNGMQQQKETMSCSFDKHSLRQENRVKMHFTNDTDSVCLDTGDIEQEKTEEGNRNDTHLIKDMESSGIDTGDFKKENRSKVEQQNETESKNSGSKENKDENRGEVKQQETNESSSVIIIREPEVDKGNRTGMDLQKPVRCCDKRGCPGPNLKYRSKEHQQMGAEDNSDKQNQKEENGRKEQQEMGAETNSDKQNQKEENSTGILSPNAPECKSTQRPCCFKKCHQECESKEQQQMGTEYNSDKQNQKEENSTGILAPKAPECKSTQRPCCFKKCHQECESEVTIDTSTAMELEEGNNRSEQPLNVTTTESVIPDLEEKHRSEAHAPLNTTATEYSNFDGQDLEEKNRKEAQTQKAKESPGVVILEINKENGTETNDGKPELCCHKKGYFKFKFKRKKKQHKATEPCCSDVENPENRNEVQICKPMESPCTCGIRKLVQENWQDSTSKNSSFQILTPIIKNVQPIYSNDPDQKNSAPKIHTPKKVDFRSVFRLSAISLEISKDRSPKCGSHAGALKAIWTWTREAMNSCKCKKRSRSRSRSACRSMSSVAVKEQDYNYCACPPNSHSGLKCRKRPSGTQSPCRLRHAVGVYTALTPSVDQMWTQVADASGNEDDRRSSCLSDNDDFNDQQIQRLTIESRFIDQENYEEKPKEKQHASYSRSPCVCEICKRYHELFHSKPSYHSVMKQAF